MHKWEKVGTRAYSTDYKCLYCGDFYQSHVDVENNTIEFPPASQCTHVEKRLLEMFESCNCSECERVAAYNLSTKNCFEQSPLNEKHCINFIPNKDKI